jgi:hypothetical protein
MYPVGSKLNVPSVRGSFGRIGGANVTVSAGVPFTPVWVVSRIVNPDGSLPVARTVPLPEPKHVGAPLETVTPIKIPPAPVLPHVAVLAEAGIDSIAESPSARAPEIAHFMGTPP